jgi:sugar lactone lactonase YvrE
VGSIAVFTQGSANLDFTAASGATCTPMAYSSATNCAVNVIFTPTAAGLREGAVVFFSGPNNSGNLLGSVPVYGIGTGPQLAFYPAPQFTVPRSQVINPYGVAIDGAGDLFIADSGSGFGSGPARFAGSVVEVPAGGGSPISLGSGWIAPTGIAVDGAGNVFVADLLGEAVEELPVGGGAQFQIAYSGLPEGIAVDTADNLYIADPVLEQVVEVAAGTGAQTQIGSGWYAPTGVAVDGAGNVYVLDASANTVTQVAAGTGTMTTLTGPVPFTPTGWFYVTGVAVDAMGNVYVSDEYLGVVELAAGTFAPTNPISGSTVSPNAVAVDAAGDIFAADYYSHAEIELQRSQPLAVNYPTPTPAYTIDTADGPQTVQIQNIGNAALTFPAIVGQNNPGISTNFTLNSSGVSACPLITSASTPGFLGATAICQLTVSFAPTAGGPLIGALVLTDNALNAAAPGYATQSIPLGGTGIAEPALTLSVTSLSYGPQNVGSSSASQSVTLTNTGGAPLVLHGINYIGADAASFVFGNTCGSSLAVGSSCTIHGHFAPGVTGSLTAAIVITDNAPGSPQTVALTGTGVMAVVSLSATSLTYGLQAVGTSSASQSVILTNTGNGPLGIISIDVGGANASSFVFANTCGSSLASGASCTIHGHFAPTTTGPLTAAIVITDHAGGSPQSITLTGTGATAAASLSTTSLTYGPQAVGTESASQSVTLTNTGELPLGIISIQVTGANASSFVFANNCGSSLAAGSSCSIHGHFAPTTTGPLTAAIVITDHAGDSPQSITLTGTGQ